MQIDFRDDDIDVNKMTEKQRKVLVYLAPGNVGLVFAQWDSDGSSWLGAQPSVVSSAWQRLFKRPHSRLAMQSPWQLVPVGRCEARGGEGGEGVDWSAYSYVYVYVWCVNKLHHFVPPYLKNQKPHRLIIHI